MDDLEIERILKAEAKKLADFKPADHFQDSQRNYAFLELFTLAEKLIGVDKAKRLLEKVE